mgnify:CR=1 FL=1|uniref:Uncharacterized protein n=1 Tax=uncultured prokaryote TaxID=198431 RepID=A0A0H5Q6Q7_9ZZZZ|nr:hypothetical protein [uncultured prokaryote]
MNGSWNGLRGGNVTGATIMDSKSLPSMLKRNRHVLAMKINES